MRAACSACREIPQLERRTWDFTVQQSVLSLASTEIRRGAFVNVARIYLRMDDRAYDVLLRPYTNLFELFGADSGGGLARCCMQARAQARPPGGSGACIVHRVTGSSAQAQGQAA